MVFLLPNIAGFCAFTLIPLALSFYMAFTDWDILRHNVFRHEPLNFVRLDNFERLFRDPRFWRDLGNTFFLMLGLPFAIAGSLAAALLLNRTGRKRGTVGPALVLAAVVFAACGYILLRGGIPGEGVLILFGALAGVILISGVFTGGTIYRTLFYLPHFTAGVAVYVLWKKLYDPHSGPINGALAPVLDGLAAWVRAWPWLFAKGLPFLCGVGALALIAWQVRRLKRRWEAVEAGQAAVILGIAGPATSMGFLLAWAGLGVPLAAFLALFGAVGACVAILRRPRPWGPVCASDAGVGVEMGLALLLVPVLTLLAAGMALCPSLPSLAPRGFDPPNWLGDYGWAKPALMIVALWGAIGSNNMILYLAGLSNIPPELYEAADMDGASAVQRFWQITWPQLAPVTFFIGVMGVIEGLQGGFEMARAMTNGGPAGSTTTLSYFIFTEGFETGRLGYASAVAWVLFLLVFVFSIINFRFGNRSAND